MGYGRSKIDYEDFRKKVLGDEAIDKYNCDID